MSPKTSGKIQKTSKVKSSFQDKLDKLTKIKQQVLQASNHFDNTNDAIDWCLEQNVGHQHKIDFTGFVVKIIMDSAAVPEWGRIHLIGNEASEEQRSTLIGLFNDMYDGESKMAAMELVLTVTVFDGLTSEKFEVGDLISIKNIKGAKMYLDRALQGIANMTNITKVS